MGIIKDHGKYNCPSIHDIYSKDVVENYNRLILICLVSFLSTQPKEYVKEKLYSNIQVIEMPNLSSYLGPKKHPREYEQL